MFKYFLVPLFLFISISVFGQSFYIVTSQGDVKRITLKGSTYKVQDMSMCSTVRNGGSAIAIHGNTFYSTNFMLQGKATISGNDLINCSNLGITVPSNSFTADKNGMLYTASDKLYKTDPATLTSTLIGVMPYHSAGDLAFYKNDLYMASTQGIVKINLTNPSQSTLVISALQGAWGLTTAAYSSTQNKVYAFVGSNVFIGYTDIYELDLDNNLVGPIVASIPYSVYDAASTVEDGSSPPIEISSIKQYADCPYTGKGTIEVICENALVDYQYTLNGVTNNTGIFSNLSPGTYNITITSPNETKSTSITVTQFNLEKPVLQITSVNPLCVAPGQIKIATANDGSLYKIKYGNAIYNFDHTFNNLAAGTHHFVILNSAGCEVDATDVTLTQDLCKITVTGTTITEECNDPGKGKVQIAVAANNETYTYSINTVSNTTGVFNSLNPGTYQVNIVSSNGDTKSLSVVIPDYNSSKPIINIVQKDPECQTAGTVSFTISNGSAALYRIKLGANIFPFNHVFTNLTAGNYHFDIVKQDNCVLTAKDVVLTRTKCLIVLDNNEINEECNLPGKGVVKVNVKPHQDNYTYTLNSISNNTGVFNNLAPGNYQIKITGSEDEKIVDIVVPDYNLTKPAVTYIASNIVCDTLGTIKLVMQNVNTGIYRIKLGAAIYPFDHLFTGLATGTHHFEIIKQDGCILTAIDVVLIRNKCEIVLNGADVQQECDLIYKGSIQVKSKPHAYTYTYTLNSTTNGTGIFNNLAPGNYNIIVTSSEDQEQISVTVPDYKLNAPIVTYTAKNAICEITGSIKFNLLVNDQQYKIRFNGSTYPFNHNFTNLEQGIYDFTVIKPDGCLLDVYTVDLKKEECQTVTFPNTFTPNGDGINDIFRASPNSAATSFMFRIYTRNGVLLFTSQNSHNGWDGQYNGQQVAAGVYYWSANYTNNTGKSFTQSGYVTLIR